MRRGFWFLAGAGAGIYAVSKARRAAEAFTPDGLRDRLAGLTLGAHLFGDEVRAETHEAENELRARLHLGLDGTTPDRQLESSDRPLELTRRVND